MIFHFKRLLPLIVAISLPIGPAAGWSASLGKELATRLETAGVGTKLPVIIAFSDKVALPAPLVNSRHGRDELVASMRLKAEETQRPLKDFLRKRGVAKIKSLWIINAIAVDADSQLIQVLSGWPGVAEIRLNGTVTLPEVILQDTSVPGWNIAALGVEQLWDLGLTGEGVVIASLDGGVDASHPDLQSKWRGWAGSPCDPLIDTGTRDWFDPHGVHPNCPYDGIGHGTSVMGVMVGGDAGGSAIGVAPDAAWIAAKIFDDTGNSTYDVIHRAFQWALDPDGDGETGDAPDIVNNSWGFNSANSCIDEFQADVRLLKSAGIAVLFSAGNMGPELSSSTSPANYPESAAVGSTDRLGGIAEFSGRGPGACESGAPFYPQSTAPGVSIRTAGLTAGGTNPNSYVFATGTSLSVPHVSGVMALFLDPDGFPLTAVQVLETALQLSATDLGAEGPDNNFGYGQVNALAAYRRLADLPYLAVYDPKPPEHDLTLDFGSIPVGLDMVHEIVIRNSGGGILTLPINALTPPGGPFRVVGDTCSGTALVSDASCRIGLEFSPPTDSFFNGSLNITINDPDQNQAVISLAGTGTLDSLPPQIEVSAVGQVLDFGAVSPGSSFEKNLTVRNSGDQILSVSQFDSSLLPPQFMVKTDQCSGVNLARNESCNLIFAFAPDGLKSFQGSVAIYSNDFARNPTTIELKGLGNNPPPRALLHSPANGATDLALPVTVRWYHPKDPDGDQVTDTVLISELSADAVGGLSARMIYPGAPLPARVYMMLLVLALLPLLGRKIPRGKYAAILAAGIFGVFLLNSCGGGDDAPVNTASATAGFTNTELKSGTTYKWKIVSEDGKGGVSESESRTFTTR
jgi:bacillopeptidase F